MLHQRRRWVVAPVTTPEELAVHLTEATWCGCNAFRVAGTDYLFLNDATSADGAQEYAAVKEVPEAPFWVQVESVTFSWCSYSEALALILRILSGDYDSADYALPVEIRLDTPETHACCHLCA